MLPELKNVNSQAQNSQNNFQNMRSFSEIQNEIDQLLSIPEDELTEDQKKALEEYKEHLLSLQKENLDQFCQSMILDSKQADTIVEEAKRLLSKATLIKNRVENFKTYFLKAMQLRGVKKYSGNSYSISIGSTKKVEISEELTPEDMSLEYIRVKKEFDKSSAAFSRLRVRRHLLFFHT